MSDIERLHWQIDDLDSEGPRYYQRRDERCHLAQAKDANVVSSLTTTGSHAPVLDIDFAAQLIPSTTEGHFHLYLDKLMAWGEYLDLLKALSTAGIIELGYYTAARDRGMTFVRMPGVRKTVPLPGTSSRRLSPPF